MNEVNTTDKMLNRNLTVYFIRLSLSLLLYLDVADVVVAALLSFFFYVDIGDVFLFFLSMWFNVYSGELHVIQDSPYLFHAIPKLALTAGLVTLENYYPEKYYHTHKHINK